MDRAARNVILVFGGLAAASGALFGFFLVGVTGSIRMMSSDAWVGLLLSGTSAIFFLAAVFLLATGRVQLPASKPPPRA